MPEIENFDEGTSAPDASESFETARPVAAPRPQRPQRAPAPEPLADSESYLIACCLLDEGHTLDRCIAAGLTSADFPEPSLALIYGTLRKLRRDDVPIGADTLVEALGERVDDAGGLPQILALSSPDTTTAHAAHHLSRVLAAAESRRVARVSAELAEAVKRNAPADEIAAIADRLKPATRSAQPPRRIRLADKPGEPSTRLFLAGKPIATPGNLVTLISRAKTGKTAAIGAATAAIVGAHYSRPDLDTFKFTSTHTEEAVILIDTEQSPFDAWTCHSRLLARSGGEQDPDWLLHYALVGYSAHQLRDTLTAIVESAAAKHSGVFTIILDGVADFVMSVNDEGECNEFITWLRAMAVKYDCPIICVIHSNEAQKSGDDGRGHLGKQLTRKAESNLLLKKEGDITTITSEKQRKAPITEKDGVAFRWSEELQRHVSCEPDGSDKSRGGRRQLHDIATFMEFIPAKGKKGRTANQLFSFAKEVSPIKQQTFRDLLNRAVEMGDLLRDLDPQIGYTYTRAV